jgi:hypothetical protein
VNITHSRLDGLGERQSRSSWTNLETELLGPREDHFHVRGQKNRSRVSPFDIRVGYDGGDVQLIDERRKGGHMTDQQSNRGALGTVVTTKDTVAAYTLADMRRIFQCIEGDDLLALDRLILSGRAFHLPKALEVFVLDSGKEKEGMIKLRIKGSIKEFWASVRAITEHMCNASTAE